MSEIIQPIPEEVIKMNRENVPQINKETLVSSDFISQFLTISVYLEFDPPRIDKAKQTYERVKLEGGFKKYSEIYPDTEYLNATNNENRGVIFELDERVGALEVLLDSFLQEDTSSANIDQKIHEFKKVYHEIDELVGRHDLSQES